MPLADLGPEPFDAELTPQYLQERLQKTNRKIKVVLLDQRLLVGLGNIYVDEVLFRSHIHPEREAVIFNGRRNRESLRSDCYNARRSSEARRKYN